MVIKTEEETKKTVLPTEQQATFLPLTTARTQVIPPQVELEANKTKQQFDTREVLAVIDRLNGLVNSTYKEDLIEKFQLSKYADSLQLASNIIIEAEGVNNKFIPLEQINLVLAQIDHPDFKQLSMLANAAKHLNIGDICGTCHASMSKAEVRADDQGNWMFKLTGVPASVTYKICIKFISKDDTFPIINLDFVYKPQEDQSFGIENFERKKRHHGREKTDTEQSIQAIENRKKQLLPQVYGYNVDSEEFIASNWERAIQQSCSIADPDSFVPLQEKIHATLNTDQLKRIIGIKLKPIENNVKKLIMFLNQHPDLEDMISIESFFGNPENISAELFVPGASIDLIREQKLEMLKTIEEIVKGIELELQSEDANAAPAPAPRLQF